MSFLEKHSIQFLLSITLMCHCVYVSANENELIIGLDADMSAVAKQGGQAIERGALLAIDEINAAGGVLGKPLKLMITDHRGNPARGVDNIRELVQTPNLVGILGGVHSSVVINELNAIHESPIVFISVWAAGTKVVDNGFDPNYVFRVSVRDEHAGLVLIDHAVERKINKVALLLERTAWGRSNEISIGEAAKKQGVEIVDIQWFNWGSTDKMDQLEHIKKSGAQSIILVANAPEGSQKARNFVALDLHKTMPIFSHWGIASGSFVESTGLDILNQIDITVLQTFSFLENKSLRAQSVFESYQKMFMPAVSKVDIPAQVGVAQGYDAVHLLALAIKKAGTIKPELIRLAMVDNLEYSGLVKEYSPAFVESNHEALKVSDYLLTKFDSKGRLIPIDYMQ